MQPQTLAEQLFFLTVPIWGEDDDAQWSGTGFILAVSVGEDQDLMVLVTNKHVLAKPDRTHIGIHVADPSGDWHAGVGHRVNLQLMGVDIIVGHPDESVDVAVVPVGPILGGTFEGRRPFFRSFTVRDLMMDDRLEQLDALEDVFFVGYPAGISDTVHNTPIVRRGLAATPLSLDYRGEPAFLIDASVHPGSSGSPVILFNSGSYRLRQGGLAIGSRFGLLGVLAAVHANLLTVDYIAMPAEERPVVRQPVGLGIVYKSHTILETVDVLCERLGVERVRSEDNA